MEGTAGGKRTQQAQRKQSEPPLPTIDSCLEQLEGILHSMEDESVSLEQSFSLYEQGMKLVKDINGRIDQVEKDILVLDGEGEI